MLTSPASSHVYLRTQTPIRQGPLHLLHDLKSLSIPQPPSLMQSQALEPSLTSHILLPVHPYVPAKPKQPSNSSRAFQKPPLTDPYHPPRPHTSEALLQIRSTCIDCTYLLTHKPTEQAFTTSPPIKRAEHPIACLKPPLSILIMLQ